MQSFHGQTVLSAPFVSKCYLSHPHFVVVEMILHGSCIHIFRRVFFFPHRNVQRWTVALMSNEEKMQYSVKVKKKVFCSIPPSSRELNRIWRSEKKPTLWYQPSPGQFKEVRSTDLKEIENIKKKQILTGFRKANGRLTVFGSSF